MWTMKDIYFYPGKDSYKKARILHFIITLYLQSILARGLTEFGFFFALKTTDKIKREQLS